MFVYIMEKKKTLDEMLELIKKFQLKPAPPEPKQPNYKPDDDTMDYGFMKEDHKDRKFPCFSY